MVGNSTGGGDARAAVDVYIAKVPEPFRGALEELRATILGIDPDLQEAMVYGVPGFRHNGALVCYAAFKSHCGFYPMSPALMDTLADELAGYRTAKGTIQFTPDKPLPRRLVERIVKARIKQNAAGQK